jgi:hypothetical protein
LVRRLLTLLLVVALAMAACASGKRSGGGSVTVGSTTTAAGGAPASTTTRPKGGSSAATTTKPRPSGTTAPGSSGGSGGGGTTSTAMRPVPTTAAGDDGSQGPPGAFARTMLRPQPAKAIVWERMEQQGAAPNRASVDHATSVLADVSGKQITVNGPIAVPGGAKAWTADDIAATADSLSATAQGNGKAVLHVLFLKGTFEGNTEVLGVAVRGDVLALFSDVVTKAANPPLVTRAEVEDAVLMHEQGHELGLVDLARDTGRADPQHPGHSKNSKSVMYWAVESSLVGQLLGGPPPRDFDSDDLADLRALRNGA